MAAELEQEIMASHRFLSGRGYATFELERLHSIITKFKESPRFGWAVDILNHFSLNPERLISLVDILDIGSKLETAADILEKRGVRRQTNPDGWTTLDERFSFWIPIFPQSVSWSFSFNRKIRAFRLNTLIENDDRKPIDFQIECCLGARDIETDGIKVLARPAGADETDFKPVYAGGDRPVRSRRLALTAAKQLENSARDNCP